MIQNYLPLFKGLLIALLTVLLVEARAQQLPYLSFSSISTTQIGSRWLSQPFLTPLQSDCISLNMGLGLHFAQKKHGVFEVDCWEEDSLSDSKFLFYPNPVQSSATLLVLSQGTLHHKVQLQLVDALGRTVKLQWATWQELKAGCAIEVSQLSSGVYFLRITSSAFQHVIKIIKS